MMKFQTRPPAVVLTAALALLLGHTADAAILIPSEVDAITTTGSIVDSITVGSTTYNTLIAPTAVASTETRADDWIWKNDGTTEPTSYTDILGGNDIATGSLNDTFTVQFGGALTDTSLVYVLVNSDAPSYQSGDGRPVIYALDAAGNRIGGGPGFEIGTVSLGTMPVLDTSVTYNRTGGTTLDRLIVGFAFTLTDLELTGTGATGLEFASADGTSPTIDPNAIGIAVPEPGSLALLGLAGLLVARRRHA